MSHPVIVLNGANGNTGTATLKSLIRRDPSVEIRAGTRDPKKFKSLSGGKNLSVVQLDANDRESIHKACKGATTVLVIMPGSEGMSSVEDRLKPVLTMFEVIKDIESIQHVVYYSAVMAEAPDWTFGQIMLRGEHALKSLGKNYTILRLGQFMENYLGSAQQIREGTLIQPTKHAKYGPISVQDLGEATAAVLLGGKQYYGKTFELYGPELLSGEEIALRFSEALGRKVTHVSPSGAEYQKVLEGFGFPGWVANGFRGLWEAVEAGYGSKDYAGNDWPRLVPDRTPLTIRDWATQHKREFLGEEHAKDTDSKKETTHASSSKHHKDTDSKKVHERLSDDEDSKKVDDHHSKDQDSKKHHHHHSEEHRPKPDEEVHIPQDKLLANIPRMLNADNADKIHHEAVHDKHAHASS